MVSAIASSSGGCSRQRDSTSATNSGLTSPSKGQPKAAARVSVVRSPAELARRANRCQEPIASAIDIPWFRRLKVSLATTTMLASSIPAAIARSRPRSFSTRPIQETRPRGSGSGDRLGVGHLRDQPGMDEARGLDPARAGVDQSLDQPQLRGGREHRRLVLQSVAWCDLDNLHPVCIQPFLSYRQTVSNVLLSRPSACQHCMQSGGRRVVRGYGFEEHDSHAARTHPGRLARGGREAGRDRTRQPSRRQSHPGPRSVVPLGRRGSGRDRSEPGRQGGEMVGPTIWSRSSSCGCGWSPTLSVWPCRG